MGCWDSPCAICGAPSRFSTSDFTDHRPNEKLYRWLNSCTILLPDGKVVHNTIETSCNITFEARSYSKIKLPKYYIGRDKSKIKPDTAALSMITAAPGLNKLDILSGEINDFGVWLHDDCYEYVKRSTGLDLSFNNLPEQLWDMYGHFKGVNYFDMNAYLLEQDFLFDELFSDKKHWLLLSPISPGSAKNRARINKILSMLKLTKSEVKKRNSRPSPPLSATFVKNKTCMIGNDDNLWIKKAGRWVKHDGDYRTVYYQLDFKDKKYSKRRPLIYNQMVLREQSTTVSEPIFITYFKLNTVGKLISPTTGRMEFLANERGIRKLTNFFDTHGINYEEIK